MTHNNIRYGLIGLSVEIESSKNKTLIGLKGKVIDESKNTFTIQTKQNETKRVIKKQVRIRKQSRQKIKQAKPKKWVGLKNK